MNDINEKFLWTIDRRSELDSFYSYTKLRGSSFSEALESFGLLSEVSELDDLHTI